MPRQIQRIWTVFHRKEYYDISPPLSSELYLMMENKQNLKKNENKKISYNIYHALREYLYLCVIYP